MSQGQQITGFTGMAGVNAPLNLRRTGRPTPLPTPVYPNLMFYVGNASDPADIYNINPENSILISGNNAANTSEGQWPLNFMSFQIERMAGGVHNFTVTLFDQRWMALEQMLYANHASVSMQYFFADAFGQQYRMSPVWTGMVTRWGPQFTRGGTAVTIEGNSFLISSGGNQIASAAWGSEGDLRISDIVEKFAMGRDSKGNWRLDAKGNYPKTYLIETAGRWVNTGEGDGKTIYQQGISTIVPTKTIKDSSNYAGVSTVPKNMVFLQNGTDKQFLDLLASYAVSEDGRTGYIVDIHPDPLQHGKEILYFRPRDITPAQLDATKKLPPDETGGLQLEGGLGNHLWIYTYLYGIPTDEIIQLSANVTADVYSGANGSDTTVAASNSTTTGQDSKLIVTGSSGAGEGAKNAAAGGVAAPNSQSATASAGGRGLNVDMHPAPTDAEGRLTAFTAWYAQALQAVRVELEVVLNPHIKPNDYIELLILFPPNKQTIEGDNVELKNTFPESERVPHPLSGFYIVNKVTDKIEGGNATTSLELMRSDGTFGTENRNSLYKTIMDDDQKTFAVSETPPPIPAAAGSAAPAKDASTLPTNKYGSPLECGSIPDRGKFGATRNKHNPDGSVMRNPDGTPKTRPHNGIDLATNGQNKPITLPFDGVVTDVTNNYNPKTTTPDTGYSITVKDPKTNTYWTFMHLESPPKFQVGGKPPKSGDTIGNVGSTGRSDGEHLHLEIRDQYGNPIDPSTVVNLPTKACP